MRISTEIPILVVDILLLYSFFNHFNGFQKKIEYFLGFYKFDLLQIYNYILAIFFLWNTI